jgi:hypothetical protein
MPGIVRLVREAATKSPLLRMADRYAIWFTPLRSSSRRAWLISHDSEGSGSARRGDSVSLILAAR